MVRRWGRSQRRCTGKRNTLRNHLHPALKGTLQTVFHGNAPFCKMGRYLRICGFYPRTIMLAGITVAEHLIRFQPIIRFCPFNVYMHALDPFLPSFAAPNGVRKWKKAPVHGGYISDWNKAQRGCAALALTFLRFVSQERTPFSFQ